MDGFEDLGLRGGVWRGQITRQAAPGRILLVHMGEVLDRAEVSRMGDGVWQVSVGLPFDRLTDGAATFALHEDGGEGAAALQVGSTVLATLPVIAGKALHRDLRVELTLLRAELDLLKREFRRHVAGSMQAAADSAPHHGTAEPRQPDPAAPVPADPRPSDAEPRDAVPGEAGGLPMDTAPPARG